MQVEMPAFYTSRSNCKHTCQWLHKTGGVVTATILTELAMQSSSHVMLYISLTWDRAEGMGVQACSTPCLVSQSQLAHLHHQ